MAIEPTSYITSENGQPHNFITQYAALLLLIPPNSFFTQMLGRQKRFLHIKAKYLLSEEPSNNDKQIQHIVKDEIEQVIKNQKLNYLFFDRYFTSKDTTNQSLSQ